MKHREKKIIFNEKVITEQLKINEENYFLKFQKSIQWELGVRAIFWGTFWGENDEKKQFFDSIWNTTASDYFSFWINYCPFLSD